MKPDVGNIESDLGYGHELLASKSSSGAYGVISLLANMLINRCGKQRIS